MVSKSEYTLIACVCICAMCCVMCCHVFLLCHGVMCALCHVLVSASPASSHSTTSGEGRGEEGERERRGEEGQPFLIGTHSFSDSFLIGTHSIDHACRCAIPIHRRWLSQRPLGMTASSPARGSGVNPHTRWLHSGFYPDAMGQAIAKHCIGRLPSDCQHEMAESAVSFLCRHAHIGVTGGYGCPRFNHCLALILG